MKPFNSILLCLAFILPVACSSPSDEVEPEIVVPQNATLTISVAPGSLQTKSPSMKSTDSGNSGTDVGEMREGEDKINNMCAAIFKKEDGALLSASYMDYQGMADEHPDTIRIAAKSNLELVYVILVNVGKQTFTSLDELHGKVYDLKDIRVDNQPMSSRFMEIAKLKPGDNYIGSKDIFTDVPDEAFYSKSAVPVCRTASRIDLEKINLNWSDDNAADLKKENARFHLKRIYVRNAKAGTRLADKAVGDYSVEWLGEGVTYLDGKSPDGPAYFGALDLFTAAGNPPVITTDAGFPEAGKKYQCYVTENRVKSVPTTIILQGDIIHRDTDTPILKDRYYFVKIMDMEYKDIVYPGVIRNYVIRINATITGKGSADETYTENASVSVTVRPDGWSVGESQEEGVN